VQDVADMPATRPADGPPLGRAPATEASARTTAEAEVGLTIECSAARSGGSAGPWPGPRAAGGLARVDDPHGNVFDAVQRAPEVRRVVMTSSIAAIRDEQLPPETLLTEEVWNESASLERSPYPLAKTLAEREAWACTRALVDGGRTLDLVTINPTVVLGPALAAVHGRGSLDFAIELLRGRLPGAPRLSISLVDVRDVALAHVRAWERSQAQGRYILFNRALWVREMADLLRPHFPDRRLPRRELPDWMMFVGALFDRRLSWSHLRTHLGVERRIDNAKVQRELGVQARPIEQTLVDTARSLIDLGLV
jgi:nucleoside-diphosphate-sugar epimerase